MGGITKNRNESEQHRTEFTRKKQSQIFKDRNKKIFNQQSSLEMTYAPRWNFIDVCEAKTMLMSEESMSHILHDDFEPL